MNSLSDSLSWILKFFFIIIILVMMINPQSFYCHSIYDFYWLFAFYYLVIVIFCRQSTFVNTNIFIMRFSPSSCWFLYFNFTLCSLIVEEFVVGCSGDVLALPEFNFFFFLIYVLGWGLKGILSPQWDYKITNKFTYAIQLNMHRQKR